MTEDQKQDEQQTEAEATDEDEQAREEVKKLEEEGPPDKLEDWPTGTVLRSSWPQPANTTSAAAIAARDLRTLAVYPPRAVVQPA